MRDQQRDGHGDDLHVEVSDTRDAEQRDTTGRPAAPRSPLERRLTPSWRVVRVALLSGMLLLAALVVLATMPGVREMTRTLITGPTPTPTLEPALDLFYMLPNPPGTMVLIDGKALQRLPVPGTPPLLIARGRHVIEWLPGPFPFAPLSCVLTVPHASEDTCPVSPGYVLPIGLLPPGGLDNQPSVIDLHVTLSALPSAQATALTTAIADALSPTTSSVTVQPGEAHFSYQPGVAGHAVTADQPLRATLTLRLDAPGALGGCVLSAGAIQPCRAPDQDCSEICTLSGPAPTSTWLAGALVSTYWSYATLDGMPVAQNIGELGLNTHLVVLLITYTGTSWNVTPVIGHTGELPTADDLLCDPARNWLAQGPLSAIFRPPSSGSGQHVTVEYASDTVTTGGCVVRITGFGQTGSSALFLQRFGVLLAANDEAHALWPDLPRADVGEARVAQQLATLLDGA
jgi:hypothetical protein